MSDRRLPAPLTITASFLAVTMVLGLGLTGTLWVGLEAPELRPLRDFVLAYLWILIAAFTLPNSLLWPRSLRCMQRLSDALEQGVPARALDPSDVRRAITFYRPVGLAVTGEWLLGSLTFIPAAFAFGPPLARESAPEIVGIGITIGIITGVLVAYLLAFLVSRKIAPVLLAEGSIEHLHPLFLTRAWHHIVLLVFTLGIVQPVAVGLLWSLGISSFWPLTYLFAMMLILAVVQAAGVLEVVARPAGHLAGRMAEVRKGALDVLARVGGPDTFGQLCSDFNGMVEGLRQREMLRETFGRYVSSQVAEEILSGRLELGGELRTATVLFSDIRGFTRMSEHLSPEEVVGFLNRYLDIMVDCVFDHGGVLDKFIGDSIMAVFGAPVSKGEAEDARAAVACAVEMSQRLDTLNAERATEDQPPIEIGIGVHTGPLVAGNIGSQKFMEYTVIGDTVNLSSRIEGMTKQLGRRILVSDTTAKLAGEGFDLKAIDTMEVRGREAPVRVYSVRA